MRHACIACAQAIAGAAAGLSIIRNGGLHEPVYATDPRSQELEELQFTLGEGPCMDIAGANGPILIPDITSTWAEQRWPMYAPAAAERGAVAVFALPVAAGAARLGVMDLYRLRTGLLNTEELADALTYADAALVLALDDRDHVTADLDDLIDTDLAEGQAEVHQAAGMVAAQLDASVADALARLRAYAYAHDRRLSDVAAQVVARRLRFNTNCTSGSRGGPRGEPPWEKGGETG